MGKKSEAEKLAEKDRFRGTWNPSLADPTPGSGGMYPGQFQTYQTGQTSQNFQNPGQNLQGSQNSNSQTPQTGRDLLHHAFSLASVHSEQAPYPTTAHPTHGSTHQNQNEHPGTGVQIVRPDTNINAPNSNVGNYPPNQTFSSGATPYPNYQRQPQPQGQVPMQMHMQQPIQAVPVQSQGYPSAQGQGQGYYSQQQYQQQQLQQQQYANTSAAQYPASGQYPGHADNKFMGLGPGGVAAGLATAGVAGILGHKLGHKLGKKHKKGKHGHGMGMGMAGAGLGGLTGLALGHGIHGHHKKHKKHKKKGSSSSSSSSSSDSS